MSVGLLRTEANKKFSTKQGSSYMQTKNVGSLKACTKSPSPAEWALQLIVGK